jgi:hypothetical protein
MTARRTAVYKIDSSAWLRPCSPDAALRQRFACGNTHCHRHSAGAFGYLRTIASGSTTRPQPSQRSASEHRTHVHQVPLQRFNEGGREHGQPILSAVAVAHQQRPALEVDVLHPQRETLVQAKAGPIQQRRHQPIRAAQARPNLPDLLAREHHR